MAGTFKAKFFKNGVAPTLTRLPPGFRFQPTDEELLFQYLKCKIFSLSLPAYIIPEVNVWAYDPWNLPGGDSPNQEMKYFFSKTKPECGSNTSGYWKDYGVVQQFFPSPEDPTIMGMKRSMIYHKEMGLSSRLTNWIMDMYSLIPTKNNGIPSKDLGDLLEKWVICGVAWKKTSSHTSSNSSGGNSLALMGMNLEEEPDNDDDETASSSSSSNSTNIDDVVSSSSSARYRYYDMN